MDRLGGDINGERSHVMFPHHRHGKSYRTIIDCSEPENHSVNDNSDEVCLEFSNKRLDDVTDMLQPHDHVSTIDISDAYRALSIHVESSKRMGLS